MFWSLGGVVGGQRRMTILRVLVDEALEDSDLGRNSL